MSDASEAYEALVRHLAYIREALADERMRFGAAVKVEDALLAIDAYASEICSAAKSSAAKAETAE